MQLTICHRVKLSDKENLFFCGKGNKSTMPITILKKLDRPACRNLQLKPGLHHPGESSWMPTVENKLDCILFRRDQRYSHCVKVLMGEQAADCTSACHCHPPLPSRYLAGLAEATLAQLKLYTAE